MKAIDSFILEAANEFGGGSTITEEQVKSIVKKVGRNLKVGRNVFIKKFA